MAKWGEGDPRWIVEMRADATNVNNWHWTERDATSWSSEKIKELMMDIRVESEEGTCEITEVSKLEGEASINNRKGKLIFFYEWDIKLNWTGVSKSGVKYKGHVEIPNLSDENDPSEVEIRVSMAKDEPETNLIGVMRRQGSNQIREAVALYISMLKTEFTQGMILPTANGVSHSRVTEIKQKAETNMLVQGFTHAPASLTADKGGKFQLLGGNVSGEFLELEPEKKIVMSWRFKSWPQGHHASITLTFTDKGGETELQMEARGVPQGEEDRTKEGWKRYYFDGIKQTFGYGALLL
eukprot:XP_017951717.1 PREDICTED: activator of 90 kDa heat shock protein ATPase homolog 1 isoform X1 [Xenopus tropicalis]